MTNCAQCGQRKETPYRRDDLGGYVCLTCVEKYLNQMIKEREIMFEALTKIGNYPAQMSDNPHKVFSRAWLAWNGRKGGKAGRGASKAHRGPYKGPPVVLIFGCKDCGEERPARLVCGKRTCPECGSLNLVKITQPAPVNPEPVTTGD